MMYICVCDDQECHARAQLQEIHRLGAKPTRMFIPSKYMYWCIPAKLGEGKH